MLHNFLHITNPWSKWQIHLLWQSSSCCLALLRMSLAIVTYCLWQHWPLEWRQALCVKILLNTEVFKVCLSLIYLFHFFVTTLWTLV